MVKKHRSRILLLLIVAGIFMINPMNLSAEDNREKDTVTTQQLIDKSDFEGYYDPQEDKEGAIDNLAVYWYAKLRQGIDNNVYLDPSKRTDGFFETSFGEYLTYYHSDDQRLNFDSNITSVLYYNQNNNNLVNIYLNPWVEQDLWEDMFTFEAGYLFDWVCFANSPNGTYIDNGFSLYLRNNVNADLYHKIGGKIDMNAYIHDRTYNADQVETDKKRFDVMYTGEYIASWYLWDIIKLKQRVRFFINESNYKYEDYYDYWGYNFKTTGVFNFTKKFYSIMNFSYTKNIYYKRTVPNSTGNQRDDLYLLNFLFAYDITPSLTVSADYTYRENHTNQPVDKYAGSVYTVALNYAF